MVTFLYSQNSMKIDLIAFNCRYTHSCLALFYVRNELEKNLPSCSPALRQFTINDPYYEILLRLTNNKSDALFFSAYIWNAAYLRRLLTDLHRLKPELPLVLGGPQAPTLRETLSFSPTVVHDEIEGVSSSFYHDLENGVLRSDYWSSPVEVLTYPYKQEDFTSQLKNRNIYYESSRGCPFFCAYCLSSISRGVRSKEIGQVKKELLDILSHTPKIIRFVDRTFNADPARTMQIWQFLLEHRSAGCTFHFEIAPDLFTEEMFQFLEGIEENLFQFEIGIQSTNQETLRAANRKMDVTKSLATIKRLAALGTIHLHVDLILGLPLETRESFGQSVCDVLAAQPQYVQMGLLKILPDTAIFKKMAEYGIIACQEPPYQVMSTRWMDHDSLSQLYWLGECIEAFYNKGYFKTFFFYCIKQEKDMFLFFDQLVTLCLSKEFFSVAKTQHLMNDLLYSFIDYHEKRVLLREFLIFDWLHCGHRFLPEIFNKNLKEDREFLWKNAPGEIEGLYTEKDRNLFFKRGIFYKFSPLFLSHSLLSKNNGDSFVGFFCNNNSDKTEVIVIPVPQNY
jgi:anaerobic magnesium-protoporphyrin IX monomethyl ester cyclase